MPLLLFAFFSVWKVRRCMVPPTFEVDRSSSVKALCKHPHKHTNGSLRALLQGAQTCHTLPGLCNFLESQYKLPSPPNPCISYTYNMTTMWAMPLSSAAGQCHLVLWFHSYSVLCKSWCVALGKHFPRQLLMSWETIRLAFFIHALFEESGNPFSSQS